MKKYQVAAVSVLSAALIVAPPSPALAEGQPASSAAATPVSAPVANGWAQEGSAWLFFEDGVAHTGWLQENGLWYYFARDTGAMVTGWFNTGGKRFLFGDDGVMRVGLASDGTGWFLFADDGSMLTGWQTVGGNRRYFRPQDGKMVTGWFHDGSNWYFFDANGNVVTDWVQIDGNWHYFQRGTGVMCRGWLQLGQHWYYLRRSDGVMCTGWVTDRGLWYYLDESGRIHKGWLAYEGDWYWFDDDGVMATDRWVGDYCLGPDGRMLKSAYAFDGQYVGEDSVRALVDPESVISTPVSEYTVRDLRLYRLGRAEGTRRAVLYVHGGAFTSGVSAMHWRRAEALVRRTGAEVILAAYPLAPYYTYRDTMEPLLEAWRMLAREYGARNVTLFGDSAGGCIATALAEWLAELGEEQPGNLVLVSPWLDLTCSTPALRELAAQGLEPDPTFLVGVAKTWAGGAWNDDPRKMDYQLAPLYGNLRGLRNVTLFVGDAESFYPDVADFQRRLTLAQVNSELVVGPNMGHNWAIGRTREGELAFSRICAIVS